MHLHFLNQNGDGNKMFFFNGIEQNLKAVFDCDKGKLKKNIK